MKGAPECMRISGFMHGVNNPELTKRLNEHVPKTMEEMMIATTAFIRGEATTARKRKATHHEGNMTSQSSTLQSGGLTSEEIPKEAGARHEKNFKVALHRISFDRESSNSERMLNLRKNVGATYQRLVDKAFDSQVGRNIKVYVDDLVIKIHTEAEMLRDIDETFHMLRKINMKLNPKKCTFRAVEGMFLGYMISPEGIKPCPDKTDAVLQLPSLRTIKEVQSLNGKLASLNRFLSKSSKKSLPLFKTLKKCIKKSEFHWTPNAEQAFKQLKQHLLELPLLVAPKPKEELIVYLSASHGAISAVLMTERGTVQTLVYFVSHALQGPELNYTPMKKLVLSLIFAAKRLRRYFQAHPVTPPNEALDGIRVRRRDAPRYLKYKA
ncbi:reverse transcriptase domain-containing protein [Tanacetum coccineum]|uniref:Reverse transcriptase domain-containing protein n=1 Tax=Tanacetum coccineum TaxID=301880 RepID=A0ABQ5I0R2_9ASTR